MSEAYNLKKSIDRFVWRFSSGNFTPNKNDVDALNFIAGWINREKESELKQNALFAKMYVYALRTEFDYYKDLEFANQALCGVLEKPIDWRYDWFLNAVNETEMLNFTKKVGVSLNPDVRPLEQIEIDEKAIKENQKELSKYFTGIWDREDIYDRLNNQITECINRFKNLP